MQLTRLPLPQSVVSGPMMLGTFVASAGVGGIARDDYVEGEAGLQSDNTVGLPASESLADECVTAGGERR